MASKKRPVLGEVVTGQEVASMLVISERQIQRLTAQGVLLLATDKKGQNIRGRYVLGEAVARYVKHLRESVADDPSAVLYASARARRMAALAHREELETRARRNEYHRADHVGFALTSMISFVRQRMLAIPSRVTRSLLGVTDFKTAYTAIEDEVRGALNELSQGRYEQIIGAQQAEASPTPR